MEYELIEALEPPEMDKFINHESEKIEPSSFIIGSPISIVKYILKKDLREYKLVKKKRRRTNQL